MTTAKATTPEILELLTSLFAQVLLPSLFHARVHVAEQRDYCQGDYRQRFSIFSLVSSIQSRAV